MLQFIWSKTPPAVSNRACTLETLSADTIKRLKENFDSDFYLNQNPDVRQTGIDPFQHFLQFGADELRDPAPNFSTKYYAAEHAKFIPDGTHPFVHYVLNGKRDRRAATAEEMLAQVIEAIKPYFDRTFYLSLYQDVGDRQANPLEHYVRLGAREGRDPNATFSSRWYRENFMAMEPISANPLDHFIRCGADLVYSAPLHLAANELRTIAEGFDADFYKLKYGLPKDGKTDPLRHYLTVGWLLGYDPTAQFSTSFYMKAYRQQLPPGTNPLVHYVLEGSRHRFVGVHRLTEAERETTVRSKFDQNFYLSANPDVRMVALDPFEHYMILGWKQGRDPSPLFSTVFYSRAYPDVAQSGMQPLVHYVAHGHGRLTRSVRPYLEVAPHLGNYSENEIYSRCQDLMFPLALETTKRLVVVVAPEHNEMSGGIYSIFSISRVLQRTKKQHGYDVILMTRPNSSKVTYLRQSNFRNSESIFRFDQIIYCAEVEDLFIHIPEYTAKNFLSDCSEPVIRYLLSRKKLNVNILNQNIELMPDASSLADLRRVADELTQSVAHHSYFNQNMTDRYQLPSLLLPPYTDVREYPRSRADKKDNLVIFSLDEAWYKPKILELIQAGFPRYQLVEIRGMSFDDYMELATRCRFSISFGEGFDGYVAQPIYQGGIGITVFREDFFPSLDFLKFPNFFKDASALLEGIVTFMHRIAHNPAEYDELNNLLMLEYNRLYNIDDYEKRVVKLARREFDLFPNITKG